MEDKETKNGFTNEETLLAIENLQDHNSLKYSSDKDYSGCEHKDNEFCSIAKYAGTKCKNNLNCYYKQLQACQEQVATKTNECEELRDQLKISDYSNNQWHTECIKLEQENTALKQQIEEMKNTYEVDENGESLLVFNLSKIIADKKQQLDYVQNNLNSAVEALEKIISLKAKVIQTYNPLSLLDTLQVKGIAKTALDKIKGK